MSTNDRDQRIGDVMLDMQNISLSFGGVKQSGLGREGGRAGLEEFLEIKYTLLGRLDV